MSILAPVAPARAIFYPVSDGKPMGETDAHIQEIMDLIAALKEFYRDQPDVYVAGDLLLYYQEGNPRQFVVPDVFVALGLPNHLRRTFLLWQEGKAPTVIWEITSRGTRKQDLLGKRELYARLGVQEYFLFDPLNEYLKPPFQGFRLAGDQYEPLLPDADGALHSAALGLRMVVENRRLRLVDLATSKPLLRPSELYAARRAAQAQAAAEAAARQAAEEELARLRAELARLRGEDEANP